MRIPFRKITAVFVAAAFVAACGAPSVSAGPTDSREYKIKAAYLFNFAQFVDWPSGADGKDTFTIGILGADPFGSDIETLQTETVRDKRVIVKRFRNVKQAGGCDLLFISMSEYSRLDGILRDLRGKNVLTVGETARFAEAGGVVSFVFRDDKIRFVINRASADRHGLRVDSQLLSLADRIIT